MLPNFTLFYFFFSCFDSNQQREKEREVEQLSTKKTKTVRKPTTHNSSTKKTKTPTQNCLVWKKKMSNTCWVCYVDFMFTGFFFWVGFVKIILIYVDLCWWTHVIVLELYSKIYVDVVVIVTMTGSDWWFALICCGHCNNDPWLL